MCNKFCVLSKREARNGSRKQEALVNEHNDRIYLHKALQLFTHFSLGARRRTLESFRAFNAFAQIVNNDCDVQTKQKDEDGKKILVAQRKSLCRRRRSINFGHLPVPWLMALIVDLHTIFSRRLYVLSVLRRFRVRATNRLNDFF